MFDINFINDTKTYFINKYGAFIEYLSNTYFQTLKTIKENYELYLHDYFNPFISRIKIELNDIFSIIGLIKNSLSETTQNIIGVGLILILLLVLLSIFGSYSKREKLRTKTLIHKNQKQTPSKTDAKNNSQTSREKLMELEIKLLELQYQFNKREISQKEYIKSSLKIGEEAKEI